MSPTFLKINNCFDLKQWHHNDNLTRHIFRWIPDFFLPTGKTYCLFNLIWPGPEILNETPFGFDTYLLYIGLEYTDWQWLRDFCHRFNDSQVVLISPYDRALDILPNLKILQYDVWPEILDQHIKEKKPPKLTTTNREKKISSLCNKIREARCYVTAHIYQTWNAADYVISWRGWLGKQEDLYFLEECGINKIDKLKKYIAENLYKLKIEPDGGFTNTPLENLQIDWVAYRNCLINCTNESVSVSHHFSDDHVEKIFPGPYLTEKTWKSLLSGTAILPVGQYRTYEYLKTLGFVFDYPWNQDFDSTPEDFERIMMILDCLDYIKQTDFDFLDQSTKFSRQYNQDHIYGGGLITASRIKHERIFSDFQI